MGAMIDEARLTHALNEALDCGTGASSIRDHHYLDGADAAGCFAGGSGGWEGVVVEVMVAVGPGNIGLVDIGVVPVMYVSGGIVEGLGDQAVDVAVAGSV
ncbi:hypothetical protein ACFQZZ_29730 [Nocardia sp. GCM10030253]|uniref:hypothetical protein n=1 Tax=Nocardia sp. GCM10030253 TaxID=3273404 RepID=UPI003644512B